MMMIRTAAEVRHQVRNSRAAQEHLEHPPRASRDDAKVSLSKSSSCSSQSLGAAARGAPVRDRAASLRPRGGPCSSGLIHPALLTQQPAAAVRSLLRTGPLCPVFSTLAPRCVRALAERGPTGSSRAHRVGDSWLKPCSRLCRGLCAWRGPFRCAVGEEGVSRPHGGSACSQRCSAPFCPHAPFRVFC